MDLLLQQPSGLLGLPCKLFLHITETAGSAASSKWCRSERGHSILRPHASPSHLQRPRSSKRERPRPFDPDSGCGLVNQPLSVCCQGQSLRTVTETQLPAATRGQQRATCNHWSVGMGVLTCFYCSCSWVCKFWKLKKHMADVCGVREPEQRPDGVEVKGKGQESYLVRSSLRCHTGPRDHPAPEPRGRKEQCQFMWEIQTCQNTP